MLEVNIKQEKKSKHSEMQTQQCCQQDPFLCQEQAPVGCPMAPCPEGSSTLPSSLSPTFPIGSPARL